jgi:cadmium resistance protein CadD (predicted permease)
MMKQPQIEALTPRIKVLQIICGALMLGILVATALVSVVQTKPINSNLELLPLIGVAAAVMGSMAALFIPVMNRKQAVKRIADEKVVPEKLPERLFAMFQTSKIIGFAMLEGPAFLNVMSWFLESSLISLGVVIVILVLMVMGFPGTGRTLNKIEDMIDEHANIQDGR